MDMTAVRSHINTVDIYTVSDVQAKLELLEHDLPILQIELIRNFNVVYAIITKRVRAATKLGQFEHSEFLRQFDIRFASYYLMALKAYLRSMPTAPAWEKAFRSSEQRNISPFKAMILGVNAHITNDIPQALMDVGASKQHYRDYTLINTIIGDSLTEAIGALQSDTHLLNPQRKLLTPLYKPFIRLLICKWRWSTWQRYQRMRSRKMTVQHIEHAAARKASWLAWLPI